MISAVLKRVPFVLLLIGLLALPAAAIVLEVRTVDRLGGDPATGVAVGGEPVLFETDKEEVLNGEASWAEGRAVVAPSWSGVVTSIAVAPGALVESGAVILEVDRVRRVGVATEAPFHRLLAEGDTGSDVRELQMFLAEQGFLVATPNGRFGPQTLRAMQRWAAEDLSPDLADSTAFDPSWVVWLPETQPIRVAEIGELAVSQPAPGAGELLFRMGSELEAVRWTSASGDGADGGSPQGVGRDRLVIDGTVIDGVDIADMSAETLGRIAQALPPETESFSASLQLSSPETYYSVPPRAVRRGVAGRNCVWVYRDDGGPAAYKAVPVELVDGELIRTLILPTEDLSDGVLILSNPDAVLDEPDQCDS